MSNVIDTAIQVWARHYADDTQLTITSGDGLNVLNEIYGGMLTPGYRFAVGGRAFTVGRLWPESYQTNDLGADTTAGTAAYNWLTSPIYQEEPIVELETSAGQGDYESIPHARDERQWVRLKNASNARPEAYIRYDSSGTMKIEFAPTPTTTGLDIRLRGYVEPTLFTSSTTTDGTTNTIFFNENPDRALAYFIAASFLDKRNDTERALALAIAGLGLLPRSEHMPSQDDNQITAHYL